MREGPPARSSRSCRSVSPHRLSAVAGGPIGGLAPGSRRWLSSRGADRAPSRRPPARWKHGHRFPSPGERLRHVAAPADRAVAPGGRRPQRRQDAPCPRRCSSRPGTCAGPPGTRTGAPVGDPRGNARGSAPRDQAAPPGRGHRRLQLAVRRRRATRRPRPRSRRSSTGSSTRTGSSVTRDERLRLVEEVVDEITGFGPLEPLLARRDHHRGHGQRPATTSTSSGTARSSASSAPS